MRIIVVEDERTTRNGIVNLIGRIDGAYQVVATADDGTEGLEKICALQPDLVIADIVMPGLNGIQMIENALKRGAACEFVLLSGHNDFAFAQKAIRLGVREYLLKPVTRSAIAAMLERAELAVIKKHCPIHGSPFDMTARERAIYLQLNSGRPGQALQEPAWPLLICLPSPGSPLLVEAMRQSFRSFDLFGQSGLYFLPSADPRCVLGLALPDGSGAVLDPAAYLSGLAQGLLRDCPGIPFILLGPRSQPQDLAGACQSLVENGRWRMQLAGREGKRVYWSHQLPQPPYQPIAGLIQLANNACSALLVSNYSGALEALAEFESHMICAFYRNEQLQQALGFIAGGLRAALEEWDSDPAPPEDGTAQPPGPGALRSASGDWSARIQGFAYAPDLIGDMGLALQALGERSAAVSATPLVARVFEYTQRHYHQPLNLETLAQRFNISPKYLGQLFIAHTGAKYSDYLKDLRVQKAQALLAQTNMNVAQIAKAVGIMDEKYFQRVFKAKVGLSPGEYARTHRRENP